MKIPTLLLSLILVLSLSACTTGTPAIIPETSLYRTNDATPIPAGHFYFSADNCPACITVSAYVNEHNVKQQLYYIEQKIDSSGTNVELLKSIGNQCLIPENELSVPLFWDGEKCYHGSDEVIGYFEKNLK